jgi:hypothetical protein
MPAAHQTITLRVIDSHPAPIRVVATSDAAQSTRAVRPRGAIGTRPLVSGEWERYDAAVRAYDDALRATAIAVRSPGADAIWVGNQVAKRIKYRLSVARKLIRGDEDPLKQELDRLEARGATLADVDGAVRRMTAQRL